MMRVDLVDGKTVVHLKTQRNQPYGSERRCCEECGVMIWTNSDATYTWDPETYKNLPEGFIACNDPKVEATVKGAASSA